MVIGNCSTVVITDCRFNVGRDLSYWWLLIRIWLLDAFAWSRRYERPVWFLGP